MFQKIDAETEEQNTYAEIKEKIIRCALWMQKQGIGPGDVVTLCSNNRMDACIPFFATFLVGAICNPWHHDVPLSKFIHTALIINYIALDGLTSSKVVYVICNAQSDLSF